MTTNSQVKDLTWVFDEIDQPLVEFEARSGELNKPQWQPMRLSRTNGVRISNAVETNSLQIWRFECST